MGSCDIDLPHFASYTMGQAPSSGALQVATGSASQPAHPTEGAPNFPEHCLSEQKSKTQLTENNHLRTELATLIEEGTQPSLCPLSDILRCARRGDGGSACLCMLSALARPSVSCLHVRAGPPDHCKTMEDFRLAGSQRAPVAADESIVPVANLDDKLSELYTKLCENAPLSAIAAQWCDKFLPRTHCCL